MRRQKREDRSFSSSFTTLYQITRKQTHLAYDLSIVLHARCSLPHSPSLTPGCVEFPFDKAQNSSPPCVRCRLPAPVCGFLVCLGCRSRARVCVLGCIGVSLSCWSAGLFCAVGFFAGASLPGFCGGWRGEKRVTNPQERQTTTSPMTCFEPEGLVVKIALYCAAGAAFWVGDFLAVLFPQ